MNLLSPALLGNLTPEELLSHLDRSDPVVSRLAELVEDGMAVLDEIGSRVGDMSNPLMALESLLEDKDWEINELRERLARATALCNQYYLGESHV